LRRGLWTLPWRLARNSGNFHLVLLDLRMPGAEGCSGVAPAACRVAFHSNSCRIGRRSGADGGCSAALWRGRPSSERTATSTKSRRPFPGALAGERFEAPLDADLDTVASSVATLTPTQLRVLLGVLAGRLNKQIAHDLGISEATVKAHMTAIMRKLDVQNRTQAVLAARALGLSG
jgi:DNA-binding CsgD family transcriptional regulator